jgi:hypothetical protein
MCSHVIAFTVTAVVVRLAAAKYTLAVHAHLAVGRSAAVAVTTAILIFVTYPVVTTLLSCGIIAGAVTAGFGRIAAANLASATNATLAIACALVYTIVPNLGVTRRTTRGGRGLCRSAEAE